MRDKWWGLGTTIFGYVVVVVVMIALVSCSADEAAVYLGTARITEEYRDTVIELTDGRTLRIPKYVGHVGDSLSVWSVNDSTIMVKVEAHQPAELDEASLTITAQ